MLLKTNTPKRSATVSGAPAAPPPILGLRDIILFNVVGIVGLRWIAVAAATAGAAAPALWSVAALLFLLPLALAVRALSAALPRQGGLYVWTTRAFGPRHGFIAAWCYWAANIPYYPAVTLSAAIYAYYVVHIDYVALEAHRLYAIGASLLLLAIAAGVNVAGLKHGRWLQNIGGFATWVPIAVLLALGAAVLLRRGSATAMPPAALWPASFSPAEIKVFAYLCFAFAGLELAPTLAEEVIEPQVTLPRAVAPSAWLITALYILGTLAVLWIMPAQKTDVIAVVNQALAQEELRWLGPPMAALMMLGALGSIGAWLLGPTRLLLIGGVEHYLPAWFAKLHPRSGMPYLAVLFQAGLGMVFIVLANLGETLKSAYLIFVNATLIVYFVPFLYLFAASFRLRSEITKIVPRAQIPLGVVGNVVINALGFVMTVAAILLALVPDSDVENKIGYVINVMVGSLLLIALAALFQRLRRQPDAT
jgi:glutamate:GABA antiporter